MSIALTITNFGPIGEGRIRLRPLTVLTGPNNAGKSYAATFAYAATSSGQLGPFPFPPAVLAAIDDPSSIALDPGSSLGRRLNADARRLISRFRPSGSQRTTPVSSTIVDAIAGVVNRALQGYAQYVLRELERCFAGPLPELQRKGADVGPLSLEVTDDSLGWSVTIGTDAHSRAYTDVRKKPDLSAIAVSAARRLADEDAYRHERFLASELLFYYSSEDSRRPPSVATVLALACVQECFRALPPFRYYLPAARSGILQSHRALATAVISRAPFAGLEDMDVPKLPGVVTDFLVKLLNLSQQRETPFAEVADYLEGKVLGGHIELRQAKAGYPSISYESQKQRHPLERTSSMVSELAPVVLYLRYVLDPGELLIIEEPESHLHPSSQVCFAKAIGRIVSREASVILTTHSDYFLGELNNLIRSSLLSAKQLKRAGISAEECLSVDDVGAYLFVADAVQGSTIKEVAVSRTEGITEAGLGEVAETLYDQTVALQRTVGS